MMDDPCDSIDVFVHLIWWTNMGYWEQLRLAPIWVASNRKAQKVLQLGPPR